ncbi:leiomodin-1 [Chanos chanos]|uniref:Leiomodin-1 n=1 Tax=Chanos chanos TaxID=29144 RepID=A0A6J2VSJ1_CHACN|nr:leiomodin-1 [Chanos chanos]
MANATINRRKIRGLTRTGRQVSEDPDLDNLLSNLSPEEMEELEKEVMTVPDPDPKDIIVVDHTDLKPTSIVKRNQRDDESKKSVQRDDESKKSLQRDQSIEGEPKKESRKQEYLRKMGLSQERSLSRSDSKDGDIQRQSSISVKQANKVEDKNRRLTEQTNDDRPGPSNRFTQKQTKDSEKKGENTDKEQKDERKHKEEREVKEPSNSKTKQMISKLQEKKDDSRERERKEEIRKRETGEGKAKEMISRLQEKKEKEENKERERKEDVRKREERRTKGLISKLEEKQSQVSENQTEEDKKGGEKDKADKNLEQVKTIENEKETTVKEEGKNVMEKAKENEKEEKKEERNKESTKALEKPNEISGQKAKVEENGGDMMIPNEPPKPEKAEVGNCVADSSKSKTKEEEEEDESTSMFDEDLQRVRSNDPGMTELNVNNSEVIKTKTLIQFAEALRDNTHIKTFALANCRADDHVAYAIAGTLRHNKTLTSINLDSNHLTSKGIMAIIQALQYNSTLTELRFHNQRHICGGKSEMEMTKILKENTTLLKLGYHFELAGPRMTMTNILSRNMDRQRQRRLKEQKQAQAQANGDKKDTLEVPKPGKGFTKGSPKASPKPSPIPSPIPSPKLTPKKGGGPGGPPPPPAPPPAPMLDGDFLRNSLTPVSQRKLEDKTGGRGSAKNSRDQLLASIRNSNIKQLKKVEVPKLLQ